MESRNELLASHVGFKIELTGSQYALGLVFISLIFVIQQDTDLNPTSAVTAKNIWSYYKTGG